MPRKGDSVGCVLDFVGVWRHCMVHWPPATSVVVAYAAWGGSRRVMALMRQVCPRIQAIGKL
eukprot:989645-Amphidinium_carterae.1